VKKGTISFILVVLLLFSLTMTVFADEGRKTPSGIPLSDVESFIDNYIMQYIGDTTPGAAVVLVKDDEIILSKGYGHASIKEGVPVDPAGTVFEYGSISKLFVYTTIMRLVEEGKIDLQGDVRKYLPEGFLRKLKYDEPITMLNIMSHTAGFEDYLFDVIVTSPEKLVTLEYAVENLQPVQVYKPGTIIAYSNYAVSLAAYIAQQITGQQFHEYLMETVFLPLGMNNTSAHQTLADKPELANIKASGYLPQKDGGFIPGKWSYISLYPSGSVNGTAEDLACFAIALMSEKQSNLLFSKRKTLNEMLTQSHKIGPDLIGFAHGFIEWDGEYRGVGHGGNTAAFSSQFNIVPEEKFGVIVLTNAAGEVDICSGLTEALIGKDDKNVVAASGQMPSSKEVEGTYINARRMHKGLLELYGYLFLLKVKALEPDKIQLKMAGQTSTLVQTSPYVYQRIDSDGTIFKYHFDKVYFEMEDGKVQRISGDFLPLPAGRTMPWLIVWLFGFVTSALYLMIMPVILLMRRLYRKTRHVKTSSKKSTNVHIVRMTVLLMLFGMLMLINNIILVMRMLLNNYRSFAEIRIHILLNYPLAISIAVLTAAVIVFWNKTRFSKGQKVFLHSYCFHSCNFNNILC
jgi:CubicO group peptidase (beta-lactamase class C family)